MAMAEIIHVENICRACLGHEGEFRSVFVIDENCGVSQHFADLIMSCTSVQIAVEDGFPQTICSACATSVVHLYLFKRRCEESDHILRQQLLPEAQTLQRLDSGFTEGGGVVFEQNNEDKGISNTTSVSCNICYETLENFSDLDQHLKGHEQSHLEEKYTIESVLAEGLIPDSFITVKGEEVIKIKPRKPILKCPECSKRFQTVSRFKRHLRTHSSVRPYSCAVCFRGFINIEQYHNHMNTHANNKKHVCATCNKSFNQMSNLKDHLRTHNGEKPFLCSMCGKGFNQLGNLRQHIVRHSGVKSHVCSTCGNGFASKGELCAHLRKHTGARPFICSVCSNGFTTSSSLTKHKRIHSGEKPYECEVCKMKFSRSGILARHKRTHTGEKPYVCKYCAKAFSQSNDLSSHLRIHTGEKPFICDVCGQAFRQSSALKTHKKIHSNRSSNSNTEVQTNSHNSFFKNEEFLVAYDEFKFPHLN